MSIEALKAALAALDERQRWTPPFKLGDDYPLKLADAEGYTISEFWPSSENMGRLFAACDPDTIRALLKDAERYRWLRAQHWNESPLCVVTDPKDAVKLGRCCPTGEYLDIEIDAAMGEQA